MPTIILFPRLYKIVAVFFSLLCLMTFASSANASEQSFDQWLKELRQEAKQKGISESIIKQTLYDVKPIPRVIELDRKQPEGTKTFVQYIQSVVPQYRINKARKLYKQNYTLLHEIGKKYNVQPRFIVALWGIESNFGTNMGGFSVIDSLATLAYDGRRSAFFRSELLNALQILNEGHIAPKDMKGSWAGAMGQTQFMPSSFLRLAVDYDGDGKRDIWNNKADAFASIANYLSSVGWNNEYTWGREVKVPQGFQKTLIDSKIEKDLRVWQQKGIRKHDGSNLPNVALPASLVQPSDKNEKYYLAYPNYKAVLKWNRSLYFATAVGILSDAIGR